MAEQKTKKELQLMAQIMRSSRHRVRIKKDTYICFAIDKAIQKLRKKSQELAWQDELDACDTYLCRWIMINLNRRCCRVVRFTYYHDWVQAREPERFLPRPPKNAGRLTIRDYNEYLEEAARPGRVAWATWMIQQLEAEIAAMQ